MQRDEEYDLIVLGSGAAGLTAAIVSAIEGVRDAVDRDGTSP